ncbi:hypothetical protein C8R46DRAFT_1005280 [Mycena filopes]|nr:hypothetical protein C8R46DRAFT_1005280 [Mycena filopes]
MSAQFLDLPPELILACLVHLPFRDLNSCKKCGNRLLHNIIANSVLLHYRREQEVAGVAENPFLPWTSGVSERLEDLQARESNWLNFSPRSTHEIRLDVDSSGVYDLASDIYLVGDTPDPILGLSTVIKYVQTSPGEGLPQWRQVNAGKPIVDFGTALEEHDLIAIVTYTYHDNDPTMASIDVLLFHLSTGAPHSLAASPAIHVHDVEAVRNLPGLSIEISGDVLALSLVYWGYDERDGDCLYIYDWKSGASRMAPLQVYSTGLVFVSPDIIAVPNSLDEDLEILLVPPAGEYNANPRFAYSLLLPATKSEHWVHTFQCRAAPNPRPSGLNRLARARFHPRPASAIMLFLLHVDGELGPTDHMFVLHRLPLLCILAAPPHDAHLIAIRWAQWGPACTRWFDATALSTQYITATAGQRMVRIARTAPAVPAPIVVMSFNARDVEAVRAAGGGGPAGVRVVEAGALHLAAFEEPIVSLLPFVETSSQEVYDYGAVLINDESIIGARFGTRHVESLHVHHFG